jgi:hypothetical protein
MVVVRHLDVLALQVQMSQKAYERCEIAIFTLTAKRLRNY